MAQEILVGSVLFGVAVVAIVAYVSGQGWRHYTPSGRFRRVDGPSAFRRALGDPAVWTLAFVLGVVAAGAATVTFVSGGIPDALQQNAGLFLAVGAAVVLTAYLFYGTFVSARNRGLKNSQAAALGSWSVALLALAAIVFKLVGLF
jgi:hypothetical protein